jgi:hypothetical protein
MKLSALGDGANENVCNRRMRRMKMNALGEGAECSVFGLTKTHLGVRY